MLKFSLFPALAAVLCAALLFSCSSDSTDEPSSSSVVPSSSSIGGSSSSVKVSSSSVNVSNPSSSSHSTNVSSSSVNISSSGIAGLLIKKTITLNADSSYADIDGNVTKYKQDGVTGSILEKIDLIAYCKTGTGWCENSSIYTPSIINLFLVNGNPINDNVWFFEVPPTQAEIFKTAKTLSEIRPTLNNLIENIEEIGCEGCVDKIHIDAGKVFFVQTSEEKSRIVIINENNNNNRSVELEIILIP